MIQDKQLHDWERNLFAAIRNAGDIDMQRDSLNGKLPDVNWSFLENFSMIYDDFGFEDYLAYYEKSKGEDELLRAMKKLSKMLSEYEDLEYDRLTIADPRWLEITKVAREVYELKMKQEGK